MVRLFFIFAVCVIFLGFGSRGLIAEEPSEGTPKQEIFRPMTETYLKDRINELERRVSELEQDVRFLEDKTNNLDRRVDDLRQRHV